MPTSLLILEDGTGKPDSNSFASIALADSYHAKRLYSQQWTNETDAVTKEAALMMASQLIDTNYVFYGFRTSDTQALSWPRIACPNSEMRSTIFWVDNPLMGLANYGDSYYQIAYPSNVVPLRVIAATCEMAITLLVKDRTKEKGWEGIKAFSLGQGALNFQFDKADRIGFFTEQVQACLRPLGNSVAAGRSQIPLSR